MEYLLQILVTLVVLYALARAGTVLVSRFGLPGLIGEIIMGVVIANLVIGDFSLMEFLDLGMPAPGVEGDHGSGVYPIVYAMAELGVIFLLFTVGLETKVNDLMKSGKAAFFCALMGVIVPFVLGFALIAETEGNTNHALFLAAAMVATSVGITARIIKDLKLMDTREARIIIAAAVIDDVLGMIVLAIVKGMVESGELSILNVASITLQAVGSSRASTTTSRTARRPRRPPGRCPSRRTSWSSLSSSVSPWPPSQSSSDSLRSSERSSPA